MGVTVAFDVRPAVQLRRNLAKKANQVAPHIRICSLIDGDSASGMGAENQQCAILPLLSFYGARYFRRDIDDFLSRTGFYKE